MACAPIVFAAAITADLEVTVGCGGAPISMDSPITFTCKASASADE